MLRKKGYIIILFALVLTGSATAQVLPLTALDTMKVYHSLEEALQSPEKVYRLDLSRQKLKDFPTDILKLTNLNELVLDKCRLTSLPTEISQLKNLQVLKCQHNEIDAMPDGLFKLKSLKKIDLADNLLDTIPEKIGELADLELLALWDNPIESYPESFGELEHLKTLDLLHNQINFETQERLRGLLPKSKIIMSPPCACKDGGE